MRKGRPENSRGGQEDPPGSKSPLARNASAAEAARAGLLRSIYAPPCAKRPWSLEELFPGIPLRYYSYGRRALAAALSATGTRKGEKVLFPSFICADLLSSAAAVGAQAEFYPVSADLRPASGPEAWPAAKAVVAVNYFGFPQDLAPFRAYARRTGAVLIEDNAHGLFSRDSSSCFLGSRGDVGIFSLRKSLPLPDGAALSLNNTDRGWTPPLQVPPEPRVPLRHTLKQNLRAALTLGGAPSALRALQALRRARKLFTGARLPAPEPGAETALPLPERPCEAALGPYRFADPLLETQRRRSLYLLLEPRLRECGLEPVFPCLPEGTAPYAFPVRVPPGKETALRAALAEFGIEPLSWPALPSCVRSRAPAHYTDIRLAHFLW